MVKKRHFGYYRGDAFIIMETKDTKNKDIKTDNRSLTPQEISFKTAQPIDKINNSIFINSNQENSLPLNSNDLNKQQETILCALNDLGIMEFDAKDTIRIEFEIRKLDFFIFLEDILSDVGFKFFQNTHYEPDAHRQITSNRLIGKNKGLCFKRDYSKYDDLLYLSIITFLGGININNYIFFNNLEENTIFNIKSILEEHGINIINCSDDVINSYRLHNRDDTEKLKNVILNLNIPQISDFFNKTDETASVTKCFKFDSAHFITDHPGKCRNLHGGRYELEITFTDQVDAFTGFVLDYSYIKNIVENCIISKFDHKTLNFVCPELSWRSSTEFISIFTWEKIINLIPSLSKIKIYETESSYCEYVGKSLDQFLLKGTSHALRYYIELNEDDTNVLNILQKK